jgi:hypothetical protein
MIAASEGLAEQTLNSLRNVPGIENVDSVAISHSPRQRQPHLLAPIVMFYRCRSAPPLRHNDVAPAFSYVEHSGFDRSRVR